MILKTGKVEEYDDGYAVRLIEQGKAIPAPTIEQVAERSRKK